MRRNAKIALAVGGVGLVGLYFAMRQANRPKGLLGEGPVSGRPVTLVNTYYKLSEESHFAGPRVAALRDRQGALIAMVPQGFMNDFCIEGSGKLRDGRVVNYSTGSSTGGQCTGRVLENERYPWGAGVQGRALVPLRSIAVDLSRIPAGSQVYIRAFDGLRIPAIDGLGGFTHDGWWIADDTGGAIRGDRVDIYAGTSAMWRALERIIPTRSRLEAVVAPGRVA